MSKKHSQQKSEWAGKKERDEDGGRTTSSTIELRLPAI